MVFQKRKNGEVNFNRGWSDYVSGFGDPKWEYWLGLEKIHCFTAAVFRTELRVDLCDFDGNKKYAQYNFFSVNNNLTNYRLDIGAYSGNAGDALNGVPCGGSHDGWHFQHMTGTMTGTVATVLSHGLLDGGTMTATVHT